MYPSGADVGSEAIVNQKQHHSSRPGGPAAPIQNGSESASTYSVEQQAPAAKPYIALLQKNGNQNREGTTLTLGRRRSKKRRLTLLNVIDSEGCFPSS